jgi:RNA polymerase sigma-70 factor (ECF subfamily)
MTVAGGRSPTPAVRAAVDAAFREQWGRVVAALIRRTGDWDLAEECAADAFGQALTAWERDGVPDRPGAWLTTVAGNRALDRLRRARRGGGLLERIGRDPLGAAIEGEEDPEMEGLFEPDEEIADDRLRLIFTCCHPALPLEARVALTLRALAGLTTPEIARAFLVPEPTMAKRLTREGEDRRSADPIPRPARPSAARAHRRRARGALPAVQRGLRGVGRRRSDPRSAARARARGIRARAAVPHPARS